MSCRCSDIRKCIHDISSTNEIVSYLNNIRNIENQVDEEYISLSVLSRRTFINNNMVILNKKQNELNKPIKEIVPKMLKKCDEKINSLHRQLLSMKREDRHYHEKH